MTAKLTALIHETVGHVALQGCCLDENSWPTKSCDGKMRVECASCGKQVWADGDRVRAKVFALVAAKYRTGLDRVCKCPGGCSAATVTRKMGGHTYKHPTCLGCGASFTLRTVPYMDKSKRLPRNRPVRVGPVKAFPEDEWVQWVTRVSRLDGYTFRDRDALDFWLDTDKTALRTFYASFGDQALKALEEMDV